jgi:hypothetical protein
MCVVAPCWVSCFAAGTWAGHELSVSDSGAVVVEAGSKTVKIPYTQAASPAEVCGRGEQGLGCRRGM